MKAHILGNGPSIVLYKPQDGYVVGCNFHEHEVNVSVLLDCRPFMIYRGNRQLLKTRNIITSTYAMHHTVKPLKMTEEFNILYELPFLEKYVSAGHVATDWALNNGYDEIHLWGFDSIWADTQETRTDEIVPRNRAQFDLFIHWREKWKSYKQYNITVHNTVEGTQLKDLL